MNYERIGELPPPGDDLSFYGSEVDFSRAAKEEAIKAKTFLSTVSPTSNISTYDHLRNLIEKIIRLKVQYAVDTIESISQSLKWKKYETEEEFKIISEKDERVLAYISRISALFENIRSPKKDINANIKNADDDAEPPVIEDEDVNDSLEEQSQEPVTPPWHPSFLHDICHHMYRFRQNGVGMSHNESYQINLSIKALSVKYKLDNIRFWGKILGTCENYYVVEVPFTEGIPIDNYGWHSVPEAVIEESQADDPNKDVSDDAADTVEEVEEMLKEKPEEEKIAAAEDGGEEGLKTEPEVKEPTIPPIPKPKPPPAEPVLAEKNGKGVNKYMYFVTNSPVKPWNCLPQLQPVHIVDARRIKKFFTGNLKAQMGGCTRYQGVEAHYLRAQIARISAATILSPSEYYRMKEKEINEHEPEVAKKDESDESETEENVDYRRQSIQDLMTKGLDSWVHARKGISPEGCCSWKYVEEVPPEEPVPVEDQPEEVKNEDDEEIKRDEKIDLQPTPRLRSIAEDKGAGGVVPWTLKTSSQFLDECSVLLARSNTWPGAATYNDGGSFENIYIGYGHKYTVRHYAPRLVEKWQTEFVSGPEITEPEDPIIEPEPEPLPESETDEEQQVKEEPSEKEVEEEEL